MRKILAVIGRPGTGKSTLFRKFMEGREWESQQLVKLVPTVYNQELDLHIIGKYEEGVTFPGTDVLAMNVMPKAEEFVQTIPSNILFEGDRLTSQKFFELLGSLPDTEFKIIIITSDENELLRRYAERGSNQSETFLKGRTTKINNIWSNMDFMFITDVYKNDTFEDQQNILNQINAFFGA